MTRDEVQEFKDFIDDRFEMNEKIVGARFDRLDEMTKDHHSTLYGKGGVGLKIKIDRIETAHKTLNKVWLFLTAGIITVATWLGINR